MTELISFLNLSKTSGFPKIDRIFAVRKLDVVSEAAIKNVLSSSISYSLEMWLLRSWPALFLSSIKSSIILFGLWGWFEFWLYYFRLSSASFNMVSKTFIVPSYISISSLSTFLHFFFSKVEPKISKRGSWRESVVIYDSRRRALASGYP